MPEQGTYKVFWGQKTVFYDFLKNATFRVISEAIISFPKMYTFTEITLAHKKWAKFARVAGPLRLSHVNLEEGQYIRVL